MQHTAGDPLTVLVVGGAGAMGRHTVRTLAQLGSAKHLVVADLDIERAARLADEIGPVGEALALDATDPEAMRRAFAGCDVVVNTMGPFAHFGTPVLRAALQSGCDYVDIDDDWEATLEAFELDDLARANGCRAVIGMGASPGTSNLCAVLAAARLDTVEDLFTGWQLSSAVVEPEPDYPPSGNAAAAAQHWLLQCSGTIRVWEGGAPAEVKPLDRVDFRFPGVGDVHAFTMGHPEAITLPRAVGGLRRCLNLQAGPTELFDHVRPIVEAYEAGRITLAEGAHLVESRPDMEGIGTDAPLPDIWALARGTRAGRPTSVAVYPHAKLPGRMGGHTGIPLALAVELLWQGRIDQVGVHTPETAIDPEDFFGLYARLTQPPVGSVDEVLTIVEESTDGA